MQDNNVAGLGYISNNIMSYSTQYLYSICRGNVLPEYLDNTEYLQDVVVNVEANNHFDYCILTLKLHN